VFRDAFPIVYTRDLKRSVDFYCDVLGFERGYRFPDGGDAEFVVVRLGDSALALSATGAEHTLLGRRVGDGIRFELCVYTDDVDAAVRALRERGTDVLREPEDMEWGERMAYVTDPDGNPVHIAQRLRR
jgi:lactoylglutathione lyase